MGAGLSLANSRMDARRSRALRPLVPNRSLSLPSEDQSARDRRGGRERATGRLLRSATWVPSRGRAVYYRRVTHKGVRWSLKSSDRDLLGQGQSERGGERTLSSKDKEKQ